MYVHAGAVVVTSPHWKLELLFAMAVGECVGRAMMRMMQTIEQLRRETTAHTAVSAATRHLQLYTRL